MYLGELGEVSRRVPPLLADARSSGNLYIATELCTRSNYVWLAADDPDEGERETVESIERWSHKGFHRQHYSAMLARVQTALYRGNGEAAWRLLAEQEPMLRRSLIDARPGHSGRVALPARALRAGDGRQERALSPIPVRCPRRGPAHRQGTDAMVRSDCPAAARRLRTSRAGPRLPSATFTTPPIGSNALT